VRLQEALVAGDEEGAQARLLVEHGQVRQACGATGLVEAVGARDQDEHEEGQDEAARQRGGRHGGHREARQPGDLRGDARRRRHARPPTRLRRTVAA
jgi:hypothetical protein